MYRKYDPNQRGGPTVRASFVPSSTLLRQLPPPRSCAEWAGRLAGAARAIAAAVIGVFVATVLFSSVAHAQTDLALSKPIVADSIEMAGFEANKANDGTSGTRWSSNFSGGVHWIYVDLGSAQSVTSVSLNWEAAYGRDYVIQTSTDASNWTTLVTVTGNTTTGVHNYTGLSGNGRYVRVYSTLPSIWGNISLLDFNVFGGGGGGGPLANGTYTLAPANASGLRLNVTGSGTTNGTNVDAVTSSGATNQQWIFTNTGGSNYRISPVHASAQCLDVSGQSAASGTNVQTWAYLGQANQQWTLTAVSGGYTLTPTHASGLRLNSPTTSSGSDVNVLTANGSTAQTWAVVAVGGSVPPAPTGLGATAGNAQVALSWNASSGATSYSVFRGTTSNGQSGTPIATNVTTTSYINAGLTNGTTYYYKVQAVNSAGSSGNSNETSATPSGTPLANGTYTLAPANASGLRLNVTGSGTTNGTNVDAVTSSGATNQQWIFTNTGGSNYRISPVHASAQCLDVSGQSTASGTNVQTWAYLGQANQQWTLTAVSGGYTLTPTHASGLRLNSPTTSSGSDVNVLTANGSTAQTWAIAVVTGSAPAAPTGLGATAGNAQVALSWNASSGATSYSVFRGTTSNGQSGTPIATNVTGTNMTDTTVTNGTTYYYKVQAVNSFGASGNSNEASATPSAGGGSETIGGGTIGSPAVGPAASFGLGAGYTLVKNWNFGTNGTIKNYTDMNAHFMYHDQWNTINNGGAYGASMASPDTANSLPGTGQPIEGVNCPPTRTWTADSLRTWLMPINGATTVSPGQHNVACGSFTAKWFLNNGGSLLNQDLIWEVRLRYVTPPYFWFAIWTAGTVWNNGAEMDVMESFGYDNGGGFTNYDGRYWHVNSVGGNDTLVPGFINNWSGGMAQTGVPANWDPTQYHTWTWIYRKNNTYDVYMDGIKVQSGTINWTSGGTAGGTPVNMYFLFDGGWGHNSVGSVNHSMPASNLNGKYYEWDYSRIYLRN